MKRIIFIIALLATIFLPANAQPIMNNILGRNVQSLDGKWNILVDLFDCGEAKGVYKNKTPEETGHFVEYSFDRAQTLNVPGDWNSQMPELLYYESTVWYQKIVDITPAENERQFLYFCGANYLTTVFFNGEKLGSHEGAFTPFQFEITGKIKPGKNLIIVKVNNKRDPLNIPAMKYDWWNYGGITRSVYLVKTPKTFINDYTIKLNEGKTNEIYAEVALSNASDETITLEIPELKVKATGAAKDGKVTIITKAKPVLWEPANPKLYKVRLTSASDKIEEEIGFRNVEVKNCQILLNGKPVFLKGVNIHEEIAQRQGRAYSHADALAIISEVKALGCNFVRLAHYSQNEYTVREAERQGIMLWEEIPQWQNIAFKDPGTLPKATRMLEEMIARDKNRCAIIIWSVANETTAYKERNEELIALLKHVKELDNTRLTSAAFNNTKTKDGVVNISDPVCEYVDVIGMNKYLGWYSKWPKDPKDMKWSCDFEKPLIFSEFGAEALYGNHGDENDGLHWNEEYMAKVYRDNIEASKHMPHLVGMTPWVLYDFRSPYRMNTNFQNEWNRKGLVSEQGFRKKAWYVLKEYYDSIK